MNVQEHVPRFYAKTTPCYVGDLNIHRFWYPRGSWNQSSVGRGMTVFKIFCFAKINVMKSY